MLAARPDCITKANTRPIVTLQLRVTSPYLSLALPQTYFMLLSTPADCITKANSRPYGKLDGLRVSSYLALTLTFSNLDILFWELSWAASFKYIFLSCPLSR